MSTRNENISFIIPAYNEEAIIEDEIKNLRSFLTSIQIDFELIVVENGSDDATLTILRHLEKKIYGLKVLAQSSPNFGLAFKKGIQEASHEKTFLIHVDHWDRNFIKEAKNHLNNYVLVQGSKNLPESKDKRSIVRKALTGIYNFLLKILFNFQGTDSTGLKAFKKSKIKPIIDQCQLNREMLETELVLRCQYNNIPIKELPVTLKEKRPQRDPLLTKVWINFVDLFRLFYVLNFAACKVFES